jgi:hypothetical protein
LARTMSPSTPAVPGRHAWAQVMLLAVAVPVAAMVATAARHMRECIELGWDNVALFTAVAEIYTLPWFGAYLLLRRLGSHAGSKRQLADRMCRAGWPLGAVVGAAMGLFAGWVFVFTVVMGSRESAILLVVPSVVAFAVYLPGIGGTVLGAVFAPLLARLVRFIGRDARVGAAGTKTPR